jgi:hypothetical protein
MIVINKEDVIARLERLKVLLEHNIEALRAEVYHKGTVATNHGSIKYDTHDNGLAKLAGDIFTKKLSEAKKEYDNHLKNLLKDAILNETRCYASTTRSKVCNILDKLDLGTDLNF